MPLMKVGCSLLYN